MNTIKCPSCHVNINAYTSVCDFCGYEFRNFGANYAVKELSYHLDKVVTECEKKVYKGCNDEESARRYDIAVKQKNVIKNFPIPRIREDLFEMLYYIHPKTKVGFFSDRTTAAWRSKFTEILNKIKVAYASDEKILSELERFESEHKLSLFGRAILLFKSLSDGVRVLGLFVFFFFLAVTLLAFSSSSTFSNMPSDAEQNRLKKIESEIIQDIKENNFDDTDLLLAQLEWSIIEDGEPFELPWINQQDKYQQKRDFWKNKKSELQNLIEKRKNK